MRFEGIVKSWNEGRAFGFIEPVQGGALIFVHITAFSRRDGPPALNQRVSFEVEISVDGKKRAKSVLPVRSGSSNVTRHAKRGAGGGRTSLFAIPAFVVLYLLLAIFWRVPRGVANYYLALSALCFFAYAADKFAAKSGGWRTKESTLLLIGLAGGWPGALLAQQFLRHKSIKAAFRKAFWATVVLNAILFVVLSTPRVGAWVRMHMVSLPGI